MNSNSNSIMDDIETLKVSARTADQALLSLEKQEVKRLIYIAAPKKPTRRFLTGGVINPAGKSLADRYISPKISWDLEELSERLRKFTTPYQTLLDEALHGCLEVADTLTSLQEIVEFYRDCQRLGIRDATEAWRRSRKVRGIGTAKLIGIQDAKGNPLFSARTITWKQSKR